MFIAGPSGRLEARLDEPTTTPRAAVVLAPPHPELGGSMLSRVLHHAAEGFTRIGCATLRFNFRGSGLSEGAFDRDDGGERDDFGAALDHVADLYGSLPLWAAGYSFGAWVALTEGAADPRVRVLVAIAAPVDRYDFSTVIGAGKAVFLIHGDIDEVSPLRSARRLYAQLDEPREIAVVGGGDHGFNGVATEIGDTIVDLLGDFDA